MTKEDFLKSLGRELQKVPEHDRKEMLYDFEEHFEIALANGEKEEDISHNLGNPKTIAKDLLVDYRISKAETDHSVKNITYAVIATLSVSFFNIVFVLGPVVGIFGAYIGLCASAIILTLSPLLWGVSFLLGTSTILEFFVAVAFCGLGILLGIGMYYAGKFLYKWILNYIKFNVQMIKGVN